MDVKMKIVLLLGLLLGNHAWAEWSVSTYNIRNFDRDYQAGPTNVAELTKNIKEFKSDVMTFIEVVNQKAFETVIKTSLPGYAMATSSCGGFGKQKLAIAWNPKLFTYISHTEDMSFSGEANACGSLRPVLLVNLVQRSTGKEFVFAGVHLKAGGAESAMRQRWMQYDLLAKLTQRYKTKQLVLMGDFNTTGYNIKDADYTRFTQLMQTAGLYTTSQNLGCTSYWNGGDEDAFHQSSILDHVIVENDMVNTVQHVNVGSHCAKLECRDATVEDLGVSYQAVSDHCPIQVTFK
jgi:endonuclease/exonuclease/phosphatase family metal-dependent hydrolase